mmetsp:Transcript_80/g.216  ORF Transcript_80/g.216 Transcript_80/m.216 type:complete len:101 (-) Transcript_80:146-448(-)
MDQPDSDSSEQEETGCRESLRWNLSHSAHRVGGGGGKHCFEKFDARAFKLCSLLLHWCWGVVLAGVGLACWSPEKKGSAFAAFAEVKELSILSDTSGFCM